MKNIKTKGIDTKAIHGGSVKNEHGTLTTPIYASSTFVFDSAEQGGRRFALEEGGYIYSRLGNPTSTVLEEKVALLEKAEAALTTASGMGAITSTMWTILKAGDHIIADETLYGCTYAYFSHGLTKFGINVTFTDLSNIENLKKHMTKDTKAIFLETPVNPNLKVIDLEGVAKYAKSVNKDCYCIADNTFATPYLQRPIEQGFDLVIHSATKYLNGHGDVIGGFVVGDMETITQIRLVGVKDMTGAVASAFDAYLMIRGMKTLGVRMKKHCQNAQDVVAFLKDHKKVTKLYYPGLKDHPNHDIAKKQMDDFGAVVAFEIEGGIEAGKKLLNSLDVCTLAVSLGDTETLIQHPASMTHSPYTPEERKKFGIAEGLVRISVGLEDSADIIADLKQGLEKI